MAGIGQMRSSGNGGGSRRNTCFRLQALATKKNIDKQSMHISKRKGPKIQELDTWRKKIGRIRCTIRMALPIRNTHSTVN